MRIKMWGVRGSIPTPGPSTVEYGGNTSCYEIRAGGTLIILDGGSAFDTVSAGGTITYVPPPPAAPPPTAPVVSPAAPAPGAPPSAPEAPPSSSPPASSSADPAPMSSTPDPAPVSSSTDPAPELVIGTPILVWSSHDPLISWDPVVSVLSGPALLITGGSWLSSDPVLSASTLVVAGSDPLAGTLTQIGQSVAAHFTASGDASATLTGDTVVSSGGTLATPH